jgi:hypothetical protein
VRQRKTPFGHHLDQITQAQLKCRPSNSLSIFPNILICSPCKDQ